MALPQQAQDDQYIIRPLTASEVQEQAHPLEVISYPSDEAASLQGMLFRQAQAQEYFYGLFASSSSSPSPLLLGFINGTLCHGTDLNHDTMSTHDPTGSTLCIHSVVIQPDRRRQGLATLLLQKYISEIMPTRTHTNVARMRLIAKVHNLGLYTRVGFQFLRVSPVTHGKEQWFELGLDRITLLETNKKGRPFVQVDAFTSEPFRGNPAAVVFCQGGETTEWMQSWAREINLSETSFVTPATAAAAAVGANEGGGGGGDGEGVCVFELRWYTPTLEVDLCGHATLAAAHALWTTGRVPSLQAIHFETKSGRLIATTHTHTHVHQHGEDGGGGGGADEEGDGGGWIWLDFPAEPASPVTQNKENRDWELVMEAFYCQDPQDIIFLGRNRMDLLVVLTPTAYHRVQVTTPNMTKLNAINCRGIIATCVAGAKAVKEEQKYDFLSRFFGPRVGVNEDPVTGSAHCCLAPYWASVLEKTSLTGYQSSARAGVVKVKLEESTSRVYLGGQAVLVKAGWLGF